MSPHLKRLILSGNPKNFHGFFGRIVLSSSKELAADSSNFIDPPSPLPRPMVTPAGYPGYVPFVAVELPSPLRPRTKYSVVYENFDWADDPSNNCTQWFSVELGVFTTR